MKKKENVILENISKNKNMIYNIFTQELKKNISIIGIIGIIIKLIILNIY